MGRLTGMRGRAQRKEVSGGRKNISRQALNGVRIGDRNSGKMRLVAGKISVYRPIEPFAVAVRGRKLRPGGRMVSGSHYFVDRVLVAGEVMHIVPGRNV